MRGPTHNQLPLHSPGRADSSQQAPRESDMVPEYVGSTGGHNGMSNAFVDEHRDRHLYRPHAENAVAGHESVLACAEFVHEPRPRQATGRAQ